MHTLKAVFTTLPKSFCQNVESFSLISEKDKNTWKFFQKKIIFFKCFLSTGRLQFWQSCLKYCHKKLKKFAQKTKLITKYTFSSQKTFVKMFLGTRRIQFLQPKIFCSSSKMDREKFLLSIISPQTILPRGETHFSRASRRTLAGRPSFFLSTSAKELKTYVKMGRKYFSSKCSYGHVEYTFDNPIGKKLTNSQKFFAQCPKMKEEI